MTKEEILQKAEEKTIREEDLLEYYQIKNLDALEFALAEKFKELTQTGDFLNSAFKYIYNARKEKEYNPIQEKYFFYVMITQGFYAFGAEEFRIIASVIGAFQTVMLMERILEEKPEVKYFAKMYKQYVDRVESVYIKLNELLETANKVLNDFKPEQLEKYSTELKEFFQRVQE